MINTFKEINWQPSKAEIESFGLSMLIGFALISVVFYLFGGLKVSVFLIALGVSCFLASKLHFKLACLLYKLIYLISCTIGLLVANVLMLLFYYTFFTPITFINRLVTGRDPLQLKKPQKTSNWHNYKSNVDLSRYYKQY